MKLEPDLKTGIIPISAVAAQLARLIARARKTGQPIIVTQKGAPTGVILGVEIFTALRELAERAATEEAQSTGSPPRPWRLIPPGETVADSIIVTDRQDERVVEITFLDTLANAYTLKLPYRLNSGGRAYTLASIDAPEPTLRINTGAPNPVSSADVGAFGAWCQVADHHLDR